MSNFVTESIREYTGKQPKSGIFVISKHDNEWIHAMPEETKQQPEWISTGEAATILELKSTQAIRDFITDGTLKQVLDVGTENRPRYLVSRAEVETLAEKRKAQ